MKKRQRYLSVVALFLILIATCIFVMSQGHGDRNYAPVVVDLKNLYDGDAAFRNLLDNALSGAVIPPGGWAPDPKDPAKQYIWSEKDFNDLLDFFEGWLHFVPGPANGMKYYELFYGLCYENRNAVAFVTTEPGLNWTKKFVEARGDYMDSKKSITDHLDAMKEWKKTLGDAWGDFIPPHPTDQGFYGYTTFNEFFIRGIDKAKRPVSAPHKKNILVAPADGLVNVINENLTADSKIHTKYDENLDVDELLAGSEYAERFIGGTATGTVLLPYNYHHYHSPADGHVVESKMLGAEGGVYFGMDGQFFTYLNNGNVGGYKSQYGVFGVYHRGYYIIETEEFGYIGMIAVGLDDISSINFEKKFEPENVARDGRVPVTKGEKLGHFAYGGSTVILLFEPGVFEGLKMNQGAQIGVLNAKSK